MSAPKQLDQQRTADVEGLVHVGIHLRVQFHCLARDVAQHPAQAFRKDDEQRQDEQADQGQPPLQREHDRQYGDLTDQVGDDVGDDTANGVLRINHVVVEAAHQLSDLGVGKEAQGHTMQARKQSGTQVVDHTFTDRGIQPALNDADQAVNQWDEQQQNRKSNELVDILGGQDHIDQMTEDERTHQG